MMTNTVKAREHHGADSLDLTIPTRIVREYNLSVGDVYEITIEDNEDGLILRYNLVHQTSK